MIKILVPLDGSSVAEQALNHAVSVARTFSAELILLRVIAESDVDSGVHMDTVDITLWRYQARAYLNSLVARCADSEMTIRCEIAEGNSAEAILQFMIAEEIDLLVLARYGRGDASDFAVGGTAQKIVANAQCSVLLLDPHKPVAPDNLYKRILVPIDEGKNSDCAVAIAAMMAETHRASLTVLHVTQEPSLLHSLPATRRAQSLDREIRQIIRDEAMRRTNEILSNMPNHIEVTRKMLISADVALAIETTADELDCDLVLLHTLDDNNRNVGGQCRHYGAVNQLLIQYSHRPLLIIRPEGSEGVASNFRSVYLEHMSSKAS